MDDSKTTNIFVDEARKKYFKIEKSHSAPLLASWSADSVKKRKIEDAAQRAVKHRAHLVRNHIKRHSSLGRDVVASGLLAREEERRPVAESGRGRADDGDLGAAAWTGGLVDKGRIPYVPSFVRARFTNMPCFYVGGQDSKTGLGVAYASE